MEPKRHKSKRLEVSRKTLPGFLAMAGQLNSYIAYRSSEALAYLAGWCGAVISANRVATGNAWIRRAIEIRMDGAIVFYVEIRSIGTDEPSTLVKLIIV